MFGALRWRLRRSSFRRPDEQIRTADYEVARLPDDRQSKPFVVTHHYAGSYPAARFRFGLFGPAGLEGVAVFSHPVNDRTLTSVFGGAATESVELGRFVLLDSVRGNGESWFLARCLRELRKEGLRGVVSFSDPHPRRCEDGTIVHPGHVGVIYQASNATFLGRGTPRTIRMLPDGRVLSERAISKLRQGEQGREYATRLLVDAGATPPAGGEDLAAWAARWVARLTRPARHRGNLRYAFSFMGPLVPVGPPRPYPKSADLA